MRPTNGHARLRHPGERRRDVRNEKSAPNGGRAGDPQPPVFRASARISAAIRATVAFPVPTSRAGFLISAPAFKEDGTDPLAPPTALGRPKSPLGAT